MDKKIVFIVLCAIVVICLIITGCAFFESRMPKEAEKLLANIQIDNDRYLAEIKEGCEVWNSDNPSDWAKSLNAVAKMFDYDCDFKDSCYQRVDDMSFEPEIRQYCYEYLDDMFKSGMEQINEWAYKYDP